MDKRLSACKTANILALPITTIISILIQRDFDAILVRRPNAHDADIRIGVPRFNPPVALHQPSKHVARFDCDQHLRRATPRPSPEGHEVPHGPKVCPALRFELLSVWPPNIGVAMNDVLVNLDDIAFADKNG